MIYFPSRYIDLRPLDVDSQDLIDAGVARIQSVVPDWIPREGLLEFTLLKVLAQIVDELVFTTNRRPIEDLKGFLRLAGVAISDGFAPTTTITVTAMDAAGYVIPTGTTFRFAPTGDPGAQVLFRADAPVTIAAGSTSATVACTATAPTDAFNGDHTGARVDIIDALYFLNGATIASPITGGALPEIEADYLNRGIARLSRLADSLVLARHYASFAQEDPRVGRAVALDRTNMSAVADGHVTVRVLGHNGAPLAPLVLAELESAMQARSRADLVVHVTDAMVTPVNVTVTVRRYADYSDVDVIAAVTSELQTFLDPDGWGWGVDVSRNDLIAAIDGAAGVDVIVNLASPATDIAISEIGIAKPGVITVVPTAP